ncbi:immunoglobulin domain-containing protein [Fulvivirga sp. M361]|nr:immunoglobulin domain-containing protein [Fulvivirga sp. M361]
MILKNKTFLVVLLILSGVAFFSANVWAQNVTASGAKKLCVNGAAVTLDDITVTEILNDDFSSTPGSFTYILNAPANFEFVATTGSAFTSSGTDVSAIAFTRGTSQFTITFTHATGGSVDAITITGLQVTATTAATAASNILATGTSDAANMGINHGTLSSSLITSAVLSGVSSICEGDNANLSVNLSGGTAPYTLQIDNGVGLISSYSSGSNIIVSPSSTTTYNLISAVDNDGCAAASVSGTPMVTVVSNPVITSFPSSKSVCSGSGTSFSVVASGTSLGYQWFLNGTPISGGAIYGGSFTSPTLTISNVSGLGGSNYSVVVTEQTAPGCALVATPAATLTEEVLPTGDVSGSASICEGSSATLTFSLTGTGPYDVDYSDGTNTFSLSSIANGATVSVSPGSTTSYSVTRVAM